MAFQKISKSESIPTSPKAMFLDNKNRKIENIWDYQADIIATYFKSMESHSDVALELPTGSGKTLIGLLIAEFRRRARGEKILYLCPTNQLVNQVCEQAVLYGIRTTKFIGRLADYSPTSKTAFRSNETVFVSNYSSFFIQSTFFDKIDVVIFDDAHAAEGYISSNWSTNIIRKDYPMVFRGFVEIVKSEIEDHIYQRLIADNPTPQETLWLDLLPYPKIRKYKDSLIAFLDEQFKDTKMYYSWIRLRDNFESLNFYISVSDILIRPILPPTLTHLPFASCKQRLYMSATLGLSGELERLTGVNKIHRLPVPEEWYKHGLGRRFFIFPEASFEKEQVDRLLVTLMKSTPRTLVIVPSESDKTKYITSLESLNFQTFDKSSLEESNKDFIKANNAVAVLANRFDGIDMKDDSCRLLVIDKLAGTTHLQERFLCERMAAPVLFSERIRTRITQAIGRCTRGAIDYSAICVLGQRLIDEFTLESKTKYYHPELQAEFDYGFRQSSKLESIDEIVENFNLFIAQGDEWYGAEEQIVELRGTKHLEENPAFEQLFSIAPHEVSYQYHMWRKDFNSALIEANRIISLLTSYDVIGYRGFWNYIAGNISYDLYMNGDVTYEKVYKDYYEKASKCTVHITWLKQLSLIHQTHTSVEPDALTFYTIESLENTLLEIGTNTRKFEKLTADIISLINKGGKDFERGQVELGNLLGYNASNSDASASPDPWWMVNSDLCIVFEDKNYENNEKSIPVAHVREARTHEDWIKENVNLVNKKTKIVTVFLTNATTIDNGASTFSNNICYWHKDDFINWAISAINTIRTLRSNFTGESNVSWRNQAKDLYDLNLISPSLLLDKLTKSGLSSLPNK